MTIIEQAAKAAYEAMIARVDHETRLAMLGTPHCHQWRNQTIQLQRDWIAAVEAALVAIADEDLKEVKVLDFSAVPPPIQEDDEPMPHIVGGEG